MRAAKTTAIGAKDSATAMFGASPSIAQPIVAPIWLTIKTVLRPSRSEMIPQSGAERNWQSENVAKSSPTTNAEAPKCVTKYGIIGISMLKPTMSMNVTPRIGSSLRIMLGRLFDGYSGDSTGKTIRDRRSLRRKTSIL